MPLTEKQDQLRLDLQNAMNDGKEIAPILKDAEKDDFLAILIASYDDKGKDEVLATLVLTHEKYLKTILEYVTEKGLLKEFARANIFSPYRKFTSDTLIIIEESCGLEAFWEASSEADRNMIKDSLKLVKDDQSIQWLKEIEKKFEVGSKLIKTIRTRSKEMVFGCSIAVGLVVGLGFFATGASLLGAIACGVMSGGAVFFALAFAALAITLYDKASSPSKNLNEVNLPNKASIGAGATV